MPEHRDAERLVELEQVAVVARDLDDEALGAEVALAARCVSAIARACCTIVSEKDEK